MLRRPRILILDEATSSLDLDSDRHIRAGIARLMADATTLIVTHRQEPLAEVDRVLRLEGGRVVEAPPTAPRAEDR